MSDSLRFDVALARAGFGLAMAADVPLRGITAITGPSGSGKTTLLRILSGLEPQATGHVQLAGRILQGQGTFVPPHRRGIGYVFQEPRLFPHLNVAGNLAYGARRRGVGAARVDEVADLLNLGPLMQRDIRGLSGGEARRVALGRVMASGPDILFLDEPLTGLDTARKAEILPHVTRASQAFGVPALFVSHARDEVLTLADRVLSVADGAITGWANDPVRLAARVIEQAAGGAVFDVGGARVTLPVKAAPGERWSLTLPVESTLISLADPGPTSGHLTLQGRIAGMTDNHLRLSLAGQNVLWPLANWPGAAVVGDPVWLTLLAVLPRPEVGRWANDSN
ncbi:ATP-binding cassette domain-containing protein [Oceaniglobus trochenteri]|uniref:ATP-binding cassette domain-containing protein n=1 Tax=Oceaniglobus trochenteri TaxID=2763260 RepID=UPI001CFFA5BB|nr:ATP-binding cassette domain-containing protein [Oceaniglobus trochenteri]